MINASFRNFPTSEVLRAIERDRRFTQEALNSLGDFPRLPAAEAHLIGLQQGIAVNADQIAKVQEHLRLLGGPFADLHRMVSAKHQISYAQPTIIQAVTRLAEDGRRWDELTRRLSGISTPGIVAFSADSWTSAVSTLAEGFRKTGIAERNPALVHRLFAPYEAYTNFAEDALRQLERASERHQAWLSAALAFAGTEITASASIIEETLTDEWADESASLISPLRPNAFRQLQTEVRRIEVPGEATPAELVVLSTTADLMDSGRRFAALITECNVNAEFGGRKQIFTYTTTLVESLQALPFAVATDRDILARVVDALYFVLYEGAGASSLRYLADGLLTDGECNIVWRIKHLRNKWLRHDPEHGTPRDLVRDRKALAEGLNALGVTGLPRRRADFVLLHRALMERAIEMLELLSERLAEASS